ncbi:hypothetical protein B0H12DRAFT_1069844 [Mycena haematopus]|nr:hypothetical protein B0H12DRAFT_1069844 [Mycena haematopus]
MRTRDLNKERQILISEWINEDGRERPDEAGNIAMRRVYEDKGPGRTWRREIELCWRRRVLRKPIVGSKPRRKSTSLKGRLKVDQTRPELDEAASAVIIVVKKEHSRSLRDNEESRDVVRYEKALKNPREWRAPPSKLSKSDGPRNRPSPSASADYPWSPVPFLPFSVSFWFPIVPPQRWKEKEWRNESNPSPSREEGKERNHSPAPALVRNIHAPRPCV